MRIFIYYPTGDLDIWLGSEEVGVTYAEINPETIYFFGYIDTHTVLL